MPPFGSEKGDTMKKKPLILLTAAFLAACAPKPDEVEVTRVVVATSEPATASPTVQPTEEPIATPTPAPSPTATPDIRVINSAPRAVILTKQELPPEGKFYLYDETPHRNSEIIAGWGADQGARYLDESGRVDGWTIGYARGTTTTRVPETLEINAIVYKSVDGPRITEDVLGRCSEDWTPLEDPKIGDDSDLCIWREMQPSGKNFIGYELNVSIHNIRVQLWAFGFEDSFDLEWLLLVAQLQADKIRALPLSDSVTYAP